MASITKLDADGQPIPKGSSERPTKYRARWRSPEGGSRSATFSLMVDAKRHLTSQEHSKHTGSYVERAAGAITFGEWWTAWRSTRVDLRPSTVARDESYARNHITPKLGAVRLSRIDRTLLRRWVADLTASGLAPATVVKIVQLTSKALAAAVDERMISRNPAERLPLPRVEVTEMRFLTPSDIATLAESIDERYRVWALTAAWSGLRFGELAGLRRDRLDFMRRRIEVAEIAVEVSGHVHVGPPKTRSGHRSVPIPAPVADELEAWASGLEGEDLVFSAPAGGYLRAGQFRRRFWRPAIERAGLAPLRPHDLRHTAVSLWIAAQASPNEIATWAGHSSVATVLDRYGHLLPGHEERVTDALSELFWAASAAPIATVIELNG